MNLRMLSTGTVCTLLAMVCCSVTAAEGLGKDAARQLEPFIDEQTCLVVAVALPATVGEDYLTKVAGWLEQVRPDSREDANEARLAMAALVRAGARNVYLVVSLADVPDGSPLLVIPAENEAGHSVGRRPRGGRTSRRLVRSHPTCLSSSRCHRRRAQHR